MAIPTWPTTLPQVVQKGFTETGGVLLLRSEQDKGPAKMRKLGNKPQILNVSFLMTSSQVIALETFVKTTIGGVNRFNFPHPRTAVYVQTRIVPQGQGDLYTLSYAAPDYYTVQLQLEVLP